MLRAGFLILGFFVIVHQAWSQPRLGRPGETRFMQYEAINLASQDSLKSRVDILYRIDHGFFIPLKNTDNSFPWNFKRRGEILIELIDSLGVSKARDIHRFDIGANEVEESPIPKGWHQGIISFNVSPGLYTVVIEANDLESSRTFLDKNSTIRAKDFRHNKFLTSTPMFVYWPNDSLRPEALTPENFGGDLEFGAASALFFELVSDLYSENPLNIAYTISTKERDEDPKVVLADTIHQAKTFPKFDLEPTKTDESIRYNLISSEKTNAAGILLPFASKKLPLRRYTLALTLKQDTSETKIEKSFQMIWPDMPLSLKNVDRALEALKYLTTEDELDSLMEGSFETRRKNLEAFWAARDQTPETAYNEAMAQYYRRADYASRNFTTLNEPDGLETDRGRIYILHGPPTKTERKLDPSAGFQEVWVYEGLNKKFIFTDEKKSGDYVLSSQQDL